MAAGALQVPVLQKTIGGLSSVLRGDETLEIKEEAIFSHLKLIEDDSRFVVDPEFPSNLSWFNTNGVPLSFSSGQLEGNLILLDFFTYCCINCLHLLPDLARLEEKYGPKEGLLVVGVHSAKFPNEKGEANILNAILRYDIRHPVLNDANIQLWERLGISCWPTLVLIGPGNKLLYYIIGEGHYLELETMVGTALRYYKSQGILRGVSVGVVLEKEKKVESILNFPGKVVAFERGVAVGGAKELFLVVSDSSNHRVLLVDATTGLVKRVYGSGSAGCKDGCGEGVEFNSPQGIVFCGESLYVADTENHLIRKISLIDDSVVTVAGTGYQGNDKEGGKIGTEQEISSPWDLAISPGTEYAEWVWSLLISDNSIIFIAMAGTHQLWACFLNNAQLFKKDYGSGTVVRVVGSGEEANKNNSFPYKAALAQPSGLSLKSDGSTLFVADSESSTIRSVAMNQGGGVKGLVGGALDPMDLFAYGDVDGKGRDAKLQHPLGVAWDDVNEVLYVADSYNHKIKVVNSITKVCSTLAGTGSPGLVDGPFEIAQFSEPGGLSLGRGGSVLYVADTNNHCIRVMDLKERTVSQLKLLLSPPSTEFTDSCSSYTPITNPRLVSTVTLSPLSVPSKGDINLNLTFELQTGYQLNEGCFWQLVPFSSDSPLVCSTLATKGEIQLDTPLHITVSVSDNGSTNTSATLQLEMIIIACSLEDDLCHMKQYMLHQPLNFTDQSSPTTHSISHLIIISKEED